jgi:hypothetical protein
MTTPHDDELEELAAAGIGEGNFGERPEVPVDLVELSEILEWQAAVEAAGGSS